MNYYLEFFFLKLIKNLNRQRWGHLQQKEAKFVGHRISLKITYILFKSQEPLI